MPSSGGMRSGGASETDAAAAGAVMCSEPMLALRSETEPIARSDISVLILGETGVGKDVLARSIHDRSGRAGRPFLRLNCAALPESLLESELFGFARGAFTGALEAKTGLLQAAAGGSVFFDEVGEFPLKLQAKLLHVLETGEVLGLGSVKPVPLDVRFLAATNRDLQADTKGGKFRSDLYYRIAGYTALVPPLRERRADILPLAREFLRRASVRSGATRPAVLRDAAAARLLRHTWPGNVRELRSVVECAFALSRGGSVDPEHLRLDRDRSDRSLPPPSARRSHTGEAPQPPTLDLSHAELAERQSIVEALDRAAGNQMRAATLLGISRSTLLNRLDAYRISRPRKRPG